jgi:hypothetical protein
MAGDPVRVVGGGCLGGLFGAILGIVIGGFVGGSTHPRTVVTHLGPFHHFGEPEREWTELSPEDQRTVQEGRSHLGMVLGFLIGGFGGSIVGAGLAANRSSTITEEFPCLQDPGSASVPEPPTESPNAELARLKEKIAQLEEKLRKECKTKET